MQVGELAGGAEACARRLAATLRSFDGSAEQLQALMVPREPHRADRGVEVDVRQLLALA